jgi:hypothetical protein
MGDYVNITGNNKDEAVDDNIPMPLFIQVVLNDLIFQELQQYLNDTNSKVGTNNLLNVSRRYFRRLKQENYYWELKRGHSSAYLRSQRIKILATSIFCSMSGCKILVSHMSGYYLLSCYRKLKLLIKNPEKQLSLDLRNYKRLSLKGLGDVHHVCMSD